MAAVVMVLGICSTLRQAVEAVIALDTCSATMSTSKVAIQHLPLRMELAFAMLFAVDPVIYEALDTYQC